MLYIEHYNLVCHMKVCHNIIMDVIGHVSFTVWLKNKGIAKVLYTVSLNC